MGLAVAVPGSQSEWRRGWGVVLAAALGVGIGGIFYHFIGVIMLPLQEAFGWSRGEIAFGLTLITLVHLATNIPLGFLVDKVGFRRIALVGTAGFSVSFSLLGLAGPSIFAWYAACPLF